MGTYKQPLPDGTVVEKREDGRGRTYTITPPGGQPQKCDSVTSVLNVIGKPWLSGWLGKRMREGAVEFLEANPGCTPDELREHLWGIQRDKSAAERGSRIHALVEARAKADEAEMTRILGEAASIAPALKAFDDWRETTGSEVVEQEFVIYSPKFGYAGTVDAAVLRGDQLWLVDWKSSAAAYTEYGFQLGAYVTAFEELTEVGSVAGALVVRIDAASGTWEEHRVDVQQGWRGFISALRLHQSLAKDVYVQPEQNI